jgi:urease accessory protein
MEQEHDITLQPAFCSSSGIATLPIPSKNAWLASLFLEFAIARGVSQLTKTRRSGPLSVQKAFYPEGKDCAHVYLLHPPAGIVSGDELRIHICIQENAHALITTPGANRFYRARENQSIGDSKQLQLFKLEVTEKGKCENFPLETIVYEGADATNQLDLSMSSNSAYIGWDIACLGLPSSNQPFKKGKFTQLNKVYVDQKLVFHDRINLNAQNGIQGHIAGLHGYSVFATMLAHAPKGHLTKMDKSDMVTSLRSHLHALNNKNDERNENHPNVSITYIRDLLVVRYLGNHAEQCKSIFISLWKIIRPVYMNKTAVVPRIWHT